MTNDQQSVGWVERGLRFWIADFGFHGDKNSFEESEFSLAINFQYSIVNIQYREPIFHEPMSIDR